MAAEGADEESAEIEIAREVDAEGIAEEVSIGDKELEDVDKDKEEEDAELARSAVVWMLGGTVVSGVKARAT